MTAVTHRGSRETLKAALRALPRVLAGEVPDPLGLSEIVGGHVGNAVLGLAHADFEAKSRGGTGADGVRWPPLDEKYVAYGRHTDPRGRRATLTPAQDRKWRAVYVAKLLVLRLHMGELEARGKAAAIAWAVLKAEGARTKLELFGNKRVPAGVVTGRLLRSLAPGRGADPAGNPDQVFEPAPGAVAVGSALPYAARFARRRPVFPADGRLPEGWRAGVRTGMAAGLRAAVGRLAA